MSTVTLLRSEQIEEPTKEPFLNISKEAWKSLTEVVHLQLALFQVELKERYESAQHSLKNVFAGMLLLLVGVQLVAGFLVVLLVDKAGMNLSSSFALIALAFLAVAIPVIWVNWLRFSKIIWGPQHLIDNFKETITCITKKRC